MLLVVVRLIAFVALLSAVLVVSNANATDHQCFLYDNDTAEPQVQTCKGSSCYGVLLEYPSGIWVALGKCTKKATCQEQFGLISPYNNGCFYDSDAKTFFYKTVSEDDKARAFEDPAPFVDRVCCCAGDKCNTKEWLNQRAATGRPTTTPGLRTTTDITNSSTTTVDMNSTMSTGGISSVDLSTTENENSDDATTSSGSKGNNTDWTTTDHDGLQNTTAPKPIISWLAAVAIATILLIVNVFVNVS